MIKERVVLSGWSKGLTVGIMILTTAMLLFVCAYGSEVQTIIMSGAVVVLYIFPLIYSPLNIEVKSDALIVRRTLREKVIPIKDIRSVAPHQPTMAEKRICGSGGWFGYWGRFSEPATGNYFAYYGKASHCFMVTLKDGRKYLLGCENRRNIIEAVKEACQDYTS